MDLGVLKEEIPSLVIPVFIRSFQPALNQSAVAGN